jgi:hypothetical protein
MLADELRMSESRLFQLERADLRPNPEDGPNIDDFYGVPGNLFTWLGEVSRTAREPFGSLLAYEARATAIRIWEPRMIPGLLQNRPYAMALLRDEKAADERLSRRAKVFDKADPASVRVVIDEAALRHVIGSKEILAEQLAYLIADDAPWDIHVVPFTAVVHPFAVTGPMMILDVDDSTLAYGQGWNDLESIMDAPGDVRMAWATWDAVLGLSLPIDTSREMIRSMIGELT